MLDVLIRGGGLLDIEAGRIAAIGLALGEAAEVLDASGCVVAPGFIDIRTHSDFVLLVDGRADSQICQGVTLEVIGQCGFSCAPFTGAMEPSQLIGFYDAGVEVNWRSFGDYLGSVREPRRHPEGFAHVLLGGTCKLRDGQRTSANPGRVIRAMRGA
jgi:N-acyl-D-aspartate/D-glutamate deacylase